jgi:predicted nucleic-acid-binding protein
MVAQEDTNMLIQEFVEELPVNALIERIFATLEEEGEDRNFVWSVIEETLLDNEIMLDTSDFAYKEVSVEIGGDQAPLTMMPVSSRADIYATVKITLHAGDTLAHDNVFYWTYCIDRSKFVAHFYMLYEECGDAFAETIIMIPDRLGTFRHGTHLIDPIGNRIIKGVLKDSCDRITEVLACQEAE